ncbi:MAG: rod shape-determining protein MreC [Phycisphaerae bacterium]
MKLSGHSAKHWALGCAVLFSILMTFLGTGLSSAIRKPLGIFFAPLGDSGMYLTTMIKSKTTAGDDVISQEDARDYRQENLRLKTEMQRLSRQFLRYRRWAQQTKLVSRYISTEAYSPTSDLPCELIPARVVGADSAPYGATRSINDSAPSGSSVLTNRKLMTDRTKKLPKNLAAVIGNVLVGRIVESARFTSRLQLLSDKGFTISSQLQRKIDPDNPRMILSRNEEGASRVPLTRQNNVRVDVLARGDGVEGMTIEKVQEYHSIRPGDWLWTRGTEENLPLRIPIGKVTEVQADPEHPGFEIISVQPFADLQALREVYIVHPGTKRIGNGEGDQ